MSVSVQKITLEVRVDGRVVPEVFEVSASAGFDQINAAAQLFTNTRPSWAEEGQAVTIWASNGTYSGQIFGGELNGLSWEYSAARVGTECQDLLARTRLAWGGDEYEYASQDDAAIIRNLLEKMGIPSSVANIESSSWTLGDVQSIFLKEGDVPYNIISEIDDLAGYKTYTDTHGNILRRRVSGIPGAGGALTFTKGVNIIGTPRRVRTRTGIVNRAIVTGLTYEGLSIGGPGVGEYSASNPYIPNPPGYITESIQSDLVEDDAKALEIATRIVQDKNRRPEYIELEVLGDPRVQPGMTITVVHDDLETGSAQVFVEHVEHRISNTGWRTTIRTTGGNLSGYTTQDPVASFSFNSYLEGEDTGSGVDGLIVVVCDGTQSYDPDGTIASYSWVASGTGATPAPTTSSGVVFRFTVSSAVTELVVTLTVTDNDGNTNALPLTIPIDTSSMMVEDLYLAYGAVACSSDGEQSWSTATPASGSATCLTAFAPGWGCAWGTTTGHVYATFDKLQSTLIDLGQPAGAVACTALWCHETDNTRLWAGFTNGKVYFGTVDTSAQTCTFVLKGTVTGGASIVEIRESYGTFGELRVTAGTGYYYSSDSGASWTLVHTFNTARRMAAGFDQNIASGLNDAAPLYGEDVTPTVPGGVEHIRALTFGWRTQALYATDDTAALYTTDDTFAALTAHADTLAGQGNHMIRSGNIDGVIYTAIGDGTGTNNGFQKWIPDVKAPFYIRKTGANQGHMIGYGPAHTPPQPELIVSTAGIERIYWLWNGASNDSPPSGWSDLAFNDSAWQLSLLVAVDGQLVGADEVWRSAGLGNVVGIGEGAVLRRTFSLATSSVSTASLHVAADDTIDNVYLNGVLLGGGAHELTFDVSAALRTSNPNVIAIQAHDTVGSTAGIAYILTVNAP